MDQVEEAGARRRVVEWDDPSVYAEAGMGLSGLDFVRAMVDGRLPPPPVVPLLGMTMVSAEAGLVVMALPVGEHLYNPLGSVHGGMVTTILDTVMGCAVHTGLPAGRRYTTLELKVNFLRPVTGGQGTVRAEGRTVHSGRRSAVAEARLLDASGRLLATATSTCLVFDGSDR